MTQISDTGAAEAKPPSSLKSRFVLAGVVVFVAFMLYAVFDPQMVAALSG